MSYSCKCKPAENVHYFGSGLKCQCGALNAVVTSGSSPPALTVIEGGKK